MARGRHARKTRTSKAVDMTVKVSPAAAIIGALVLPSAPHGAVVKADDGTAQPREPRTDAKMAYQLAARSHVVQPGDDLWQISMKVYGTPWHWRWIYDANRDKISDPNEIRVGDVLTIPNSEPPRTSPLQAPAPHDQAPAPRQTGTPKAPTPETGAVPGGTLSCSGLEELWEAAGGSQSAAFTAAAIAEAESGGEEYALSPTDDYGYWQINASHGPDMATYDPLGNAKAAIAISDDGTNWSAWTTYNTGVYQGRC